MMTMDAFEFQKLCHEFVEREVYCNVSGLVEYILRKGNNVDDTPFSIDDIQNPMECAEFKFNDTWFRLSNEVEINQWRELQMEIIDRQFEKGEISQETHDSTVNEIDKFCEYADEITSEYQEVSEYWIVSPWLIQKLCERHEVVIMSEQIWGRCTTGQSIMIDDVIQDIVKEYVI